MVAGTRYTPVPLRFAHLSEEEALEESRRFLTLKRRRRSVRQVAPDRVRRELIVDAILTAGSGPAGARQLAWTFVAVSDPAVKALIREAAEREEKLLYTQRASEEYLDAIEPIGTDWMKPHITDAPYLIVVFEQAWSFDDAGEKKKHYYVRESTGIAVGFLLAALHGAGLATLTHAPSPMGFLKEILGRPENERPFLLIPVGYPAPDAEVPELDKKPLEDIADFV
jgi:iodotyrosine deiodinase